MYFLFLSLPVLFPQNILNHVHTVHRYYQLNIGLPTGAKTSWTAKKKTTTNIHEFLILSMFVCRRV
jgi:hypothetical protein